MYVTMLRMVGIKNTNIAYFILFVYRIKIKVKIICSKTYKKNQTRTINRTDPEI